MEIIIRVLFAALCLCSVTAHQPEYSEMIRIPLMGMESAFERALRLGGDTLKGLQEMGKAHVRQTKAAVRLNKTPPHSLSDNDTLPIFKYLETQYYGLLNIGKPGKAFKMILDTAWGYSWVLSQECPRTNIACALHNRYNHKESSTYKPDGRPFNTSSYIGYMSQDLFHAGHLNSTGQIFAELTDISQVFALYDTDGTLGLGLKGLSPNVEPFFYNFYKQNNLRPVFSMYINRDPTTPRGGSLFLGGVDYKHNKSSFETLPVVGTGGRWQIKVDKISLIISSKSREEFCKDGCLAYADTSSNTIVGPDAEIRTINRLIGASSIPFPLFRERFLIPCSNTFKGPKVSFTLNGKEHIIKAQDYIQKLSYSGFTMCLSAFTPSTYNNTWALGGAFLYQYYTAYDVEQKTMMIAEAA